MTTIEPKVLGIDSILLVSSASDIRAGCQVKYDGKLMGTRTTGYLFQYNPIQLDTLNSDLRNYTTTFQENKIKTSQKYDFNQMKC